MLKEIFVASSIGITPPTDCNGENIVHKKSFNVNQCFCLLYSVSCNNLLQKFQFQFIFYSPFGYNLKLLINYTFYVE